MKNPIKIRLVSEISGNIAAGKNFVLIKFENTNHKTLEELRRNLRKNQSSIKVLKNTLVEKAINKLSVSNPIFLKIKKTLFPLRETSAILSFEKEWNSGLRAFHAFMEKEKSLSFKFGVIDGELYNASDVLKIASLPGKDQLMGMIVGSMKNPISRLVYTMKYHAQKFVYILNQKSNASH